MRLEQLFEILIPETAVFVAAPAWTGARPIRRRPAPERDKPRSTPAQELVDLVGWDEV
jgi:hypothetical protein